MFHGIEHYDKRLNISKTFIICNTNLKLAEYYFSLGKYNESKKYFVKSFSKLVNSNELNYVFKFKFQNNIFSYLKYFILNFLYFNLINQPNLDLNIKKELSILPKITNDEVESNFIIDKSTQKSINTKQNNQVKENEIESFSEKEEKVKINDDKLNYDNTGKLFDFVIDNSDLKEMFILEIKEIIETMAKVIFKPPYEILF